MVGVGGGVCEAVARGVAAGKVESNGRQATSRHVIARSREAATKQHLRLAHVQVSPNRRVDCSLAPGASAGVVGLHLDHRPSRNENGRKDFIKQY